MITANGNARESTLKPVLKVGQVWKDVSSLGGEKMYLSVRGTSLATAENIYLLALEDDLSKIYSYEGAFGGDQKDFEYVGQVVDITTKR